VLIIGNSILEGIGTALLIPPVYILATLLFADLTSRARAFGVITQQSVLRSGVHSGRSSLLDSFSPSQASSCCCCS
jgi:hypothetical protein